MYIYIYIHIHLFVLSNSVNYCNLCKFLLLIQLAVNLPPTAHLNLFFFFSHLNFFFPFYYLLFAANYKANNHYMSSAASIESVCLNWMSNLVLLVFILVFLFVIYVL